MLPRYSTYGTFFVKKAQKIFFLFRACKGEKQRAKKKTLRSKPLQNRYVSVLNHSLEGLSSEWRRRVHSTAYRSTRGETARISDYKI